MTKTNTRPISKSTISVVNIPDHLECNPETPVKEHGISVWATGLLLTGELAGAGMVALPQAVQFLGWLPGLITLIFFAVVAGYTGILLGSCWSMLQEKWPQYRDHCKRPFQEIARRSVGYWMTHVTSVTVNLSLFGTCVSYLILASQNIHSLLVRWFDLTSISFCLFLVIVTLSLLPLTFLGSPKDFWQAVVLAMVCTTIAACVIIIGMVLDDNNNNLNINGTVSNHSNQSSNNGNDPSLSASDSFSRFFLAFGIVVFAYTGHSVFPVIQQDMKQPSKWNRALIMAFILQLLYYLPISFISYYVYGSNVKDNVIANLENQWCRAIGSLLITFHVMLSFILMLNPICQEMEHFFKVPHKFCWQRAVVRSILVIVILFVAESIPSFGILLSLIGGTANTLLALIYPPIFYYFLIKQTNEEDEDKAEYYVAGNNKTRPCPEKPGAKQLLPWYILLILLCIMVIGLFTMAGNSYSSLKTMIHPGPNDAFVAPCYVNPWPNTN